MIAISRIARATVAFARQPGPNTLPPLLNPSSCRAGPLTTKKGLDPVVLCQRPPNAMPSRFSASQAARTAGKCSGRQPAMTALIAASSTVHARPRWGMAPITSSGCRPAASMNSATALGLAGTTGRPSVQPCS